MRRNGGEVFSSFSCAEGDGFREKEIDRRCGRPGKTRVLPGGLQCSPGRGTRGRRHEDPRRPSHNPSPDGEGSQGDSRQPSGPAEGAGEGGAAAHSRGRASVGTAGKTGGQGGRSDRPLGDGTGGPIGGGADPAPGERPLPSR